MVTHPNNNRMAGSWTHNLFIKSLTAQLLHYQINDSEWCCNQHIHQGCTKRGPRVPHAAHAGLCGPRGPVRPSEDWRKLPLFVARNALQVQVALRNETRFDFRWCKRRCEKQQNWATLKQNFFNTTAYYVIICVFSLNNVQTDLRPSTHCPFANLALWPKKFVHPWYTQTISTTILQVNLG